MPDSPEIISDRLFYAYAHPLYRRRFHLALVFAIILFPLIGIALVAGTIVLVVPLFAFALWLSSRILFAQLIGNSILVSEVNYPRVNTIAEELKIKIDYQKPIYIFVYEQGSFNAYMRYLFFRRAIFLNSELLETGVSDDEVRWLVGRFIGYLRARRQTGFLGWTIRAAQHLLVFNVFLLPYERAMVYTGDRLALAAIGGDISSAVSALQKLLVGRQLGYSVNPEGLIEQQRQVKGSFFAFMARIASGFPHMTTRYVDLIVFAKAYFPAHYAKFEAANAGLPADLSQLAASPRSGVAPPPERLEADARSPHGWLWAGATAAIIVGVVFLGWTQMPRLDMDGIGSASFASPMPEADAPVADTSAEPAPVEATPVEAVPAATPEEAAPVDADVPPNVHRGPDGGWVPDDGCTWASSDPNDLAVTCQ